jgi:WD40 repeat protein
VSTSADGTVRTWDWKDGSLIRVIDPAHQGNPSRPNAVRGMAWTNRYMITGGRRDGLLKVWMKRVMCLFRSIILGEESGTSLAEKASWLCRQVVGYGLHQITLWD